MALGELQTYIIFAQRIGQNMKMHSQRKVLRGDLIPAIVTLIVAVVGTAGILLDHFSPGASQSSSNARMITAAAVSRAGAIEIPSEPPPAPAGAKRYRVVG